MKCPELFSLFYKFIVSKSIKTINKLVMLPLKLERAKSAFKGLPLEVRKRMGNMNYKEAERKCPQGLPIGRRMREAVIELA